MDEIIVADGFHRPVLGLAEEMAGAAASEAAKPAEAGGHGEHGATAKEARNMTIGMVIDGVPESVAIGLTLHTATVGVSAALGAFLAGMVLGEMVDGKLRYRAIKADCDVCELKTRCCPKAPARKVLRSIYEPSRDRARAIAQTTEYAISCKLRKKVEMLFAHLKRILGLNRLRLRGPLGARDEFHLAATAQNLRKLAKLLPNGPQFRPA